VPDVIVVEDVLTVEEVAARCKVSRWTIYKLVKAGKLPDRRVGRQLRLRPADVAEFLDGSIRTRPAA
jgi:putative molybdopterin biosynthesis protein